MEIFQYHFYYNLILDYNIYVCRYKNTLYILYIICIYIHTIKYIYIYVYIFIYIFVMDQNKFFYFHLFNRIFMSCYWVFILISLCLCLYLFIAMYIFLYLLFSFFAQILCFQEAEPWCFSFSSIQKIGKCKKTLGTTLCFIVSNSLLAQ